MIFRPEDLRKVIIDFEPAPPPPPPPPGGTGATGGTPPPPPPPPDNEDKPWDEPPTQGGKEEEDGEEKTPEGGSDEPLIKETPKGSDEMQREWEQAAQSLAGSAPGTMRSFLEDYFEKPVVDWRVLLKRFVGSMMRKEEYFLPNRRFISSGNILWGSKKTEGTFETLIIIVDTSGSMSQKALQTCVNETIDIMNKYKPKETYVLWCDTTVYTPVDVIKGKKDYPVLKMAYGGGGTEFKPPFAWIQDNILGKKKIGPVIYFTDGFPTGSGGWPSISDFGIKKYANNVFWGIISNEKPWKGDYGASEPMSSGGVPFGKKIDVVI